MKTKWIKLVFLVMVSVWVTSCATSPKREINVIKLPDPVYMITGEETPYDGWLIDDELFTPIVKEAINTNR